MARKKTEGVAVIADQPEAHIVDVIADEPDVWPDNTNPKTREVMTAHGIMGPKQMDAEWERAQEIFKSHFGRDCFGVPTR